MSFWFDRCRVVSGFAAAGLVLSSAFSPGLAQMAQDSLSDPEGTKLAVSLVQIYEHLAHNRIFALPIDNEPKMGRPITDLTRDDVCGCYFSEGGGAVNAEQCEPIKKTESDRQARIGVVRVIEYDRLRRAALPSPNANREMAVTSVLGLMDRNQRVAISNKMKAILSDPHLVLLAPLPVAERLMGSSIAPPKDGRRPWETCDVVVGDNAFSPPAPLSGFVARAMLYAAETYGLEVGYPLGTLKRVSAEQPASAWEIARNILIDRYMNSYRLNPHIPVPAGMTKRSSKALLK